jgi:hypothetical protein
MTNDSGKPAEKRLITLPIICDQIKNFEKVTGHLPAPTDFGHADVVASERNPAIPALCSLGEIRKCVGLLPEKSAYDYAMSAAGYDEEEIASAKRIGLDRVRETDRIRTPPKTPAIVVTTPETTAIMKVPAVSRELMLVREPSAPRPPAPPPEPPPPPPPRFTVVTPPKPASIPSPKVPKLVPPPPKPQPKPRKPDRENREPEQRIVYIAQPQPKGEVVPLKPKSGWGGQADANKKPDPAS